MLSQLRLADLQKVLTTVNLHALGRKQDLQLRITELLRRNFEIISKVILEVYSIYISESGQSNGFTPANIPLYPPIADPRRMYSQIQMSSMQANAGGLVANAPNVHQLNSLNQQMAASGMGVIPGNIMPPYLQHNMPAQIPTHPNVRFKRLAFYDTLAVILEPTTLLPLNHQRIQDSLYTFRLSAQQANEISTVRDIRNSQKPEYPVQIQLRFAVVDTTTEQDDCFPPNINVKLNGKLCQLPNIIPTNRPNTDPKRPPRPVNVTSNAKISPVGTNTLCVQYTTDFTKNFCFALYVVRKLTSEQLLHRLTTKAIKPAEFTCGLIKEKLSEDADCDIATTLLKVSLNCPLGKRRMSLPCRSSCCSHLQCFDAEFFLQMNERKPTWNCPVCDKPAIFDTLVIDGYFQEVLASSLLKTDDTEIQLNKDGSWCTANLENESETADVSVKTAKNVEVISDDIELITDEIQPKTELRTSPARDKTSGSGNNETVDLTILSDSEDEDVPIAKRRSRQLAQVTSTNSTTVNGNAPQRTGGNQTTLYHFYKSLNFEK